MSKKFFLLITLTLGFSTDLLFTNLVAIAIPAPTDIVQLRPQPANRYRRKLKFQVLRTRQWRHLEGGAPAGGYCTRQPPVAVVPKQPASTKRWQIPIEVTVSNRPTFFVHNVSDNVVKEALFLLLDEQSREVILEKTLLLSAKTKNNIIAYTLPADFSGLEVGKKYRWRFELICDDLDRSGNPKASGWIERVEPASRVAQQLANAKTELERVEIYAANGYWQDTLKSLLDLRVTNPNNQDFVADWVSILQSVGLASLVDKPVFQLEETQPSPSQ